MRMDFDRGSTAWMLAAGVFTLIATGMIVELIRFAISA